MGAHLQSLLIVMDSLLKIVRTVASNTFIKDITQIILYQPPPLGKGLTSAHLQSLSIVFDSLLKIFSTLSSNTSTVSTGQIALYKRPLFRKGLKLIDF